MARDLTEALEICSYVAAQRKQWGKLAGMGPYRIDTVMDALVAIYDAGILEVDVDTMKADLARANRQAGAARAREAKATKSSGTSES